MGKATAKRHPLGFSKTLFIKTTIFEDSIVKYFSENQGTLNCQTFKHLDKDEPAKNLPARLYQDHLDHRKHFAQKQN